MGELFTPTHLLLVAIVALILFGPKRLPELGKGLGEGIRALKDSMKETPPTPPADPPKNPETKA
jgi:sec-independent protein translocase protein TatA